MISLIMLQAINNSPDITTVSTSALFTDLGYCRLAIALICNG